MAGWTCYMTGWKTRPTVLRPAKRLREEILESYLKDNVKARMLHADGQYVRVETGDKRFSAQEYFMALAAEKAG